MELATNLSDLGITAIYTSPFKRAVNTVMPFCKMANLTPVEREDLRESEQDEQLPEVRSRLMQALTSIAESNPTPSSAHTVDAFGQSSLTSTKTSITKITNN
jgi:broad specificity phosphatase PhoE